MRIPADPACAPADLKKQLDIPATIKEIVGADKETAYMAALDSLSEVRASFWLCLQVCC